MNTEFSSILQKFVNKSPVTVMVQGLLEYLLNAERLNEWFENNNGIQYTRNLLFSSVVAIMFEVVCQIRKTVHVAYRKSDYINVSLTSLYNKINGIGTSTSAELVRHIGMEAATLIKGMNAENPDFLLGYHTKLLDGNCIEASEHRIEVLRTTKSAALPGKSLVVFDPQTELAMNIFPCEDGHAQERLLLNKVSDTIEEKDLWVADRNFCTQDFLFNIATKKAVFVIRKHQQMPMSILGKERLITENEMGKIYEQKVSLKSCYGEIYDARLIIVKLTKKTRNNDSELSILSNLPEEIADALTIAEIYRKRWGIETAFQRLEAHFNSEINSLGYPKAALFGFCLALVAFNIYAVIMASLRVAHPKVNIKEEVSEYYIAEDISTVYEGMIIAVDDDEWNRFRHLSDAAMIVLLIYLAKQVNLKKFKKNKRGVKKEKPPIKFDKKTPHVSTFKLLLNPA